jgi:hypothetical protein
MLMKRLATILMAALVLASCATPQVVRSVAEDGGETYTLRCTGVRYIWNDCYDEAERLCPEGYEVLENLSEAPTRGVFWGALIPDDVQELVIQCVDTAA